MTDSTPDLKKAILDHFGQDYTPFYSHFHPDLGNGDTTDVICFSHNDQRPSRNLVLRGRKAGSHYCLVCKAGGHAIDYYAQQTGLDCRAQFPMVLEGIIKDFGIAVPSNDRAQTLVAEFSYTDESNNLQFQTVRKEPGKNGRRKDFSVRRPDGNGAWIWNARGLSCCLTGFTIS